MHIACQIINIDTKITCVGNTITEMKKDLIKAYLKYITRFISKNKMQPVNLSAELLPLTIYAHHATQQQSEQFVKEVIKLSSL